MPCSDVAEVARRAQHRLEIRRRRPAADQVGAAVGRGRGRRLVAADGPAVLGIGEGDPRQQGPAPAPRSASRSGPGIRREHARGRGRRRPTSLCRAGAWTTASRRAFAAGGAGSEDSDACAQRRKPARWVQQEKGCRQPPGGLAFRAGPPAAPGPAARTASHGRAEISTTGEHGLCTSSPLVRQHEGHAEAAVPGPPWVASHAQAHAFLAERRGGVILTDCASRPKSYILPSSSRA